MTSHAEYRFAYQRASMPLQLTAKSVETSVDRPMPKLSQAAFQPNVSLFSDMSDRCQSLPVPANAQLRDASKTAVGSPKTQRHPPTDRINVLRIAGAL
jgi:hypothetical protein